MYFSLGIIQAYINALCPALFVTLTSAPISSSLSTPYQKPCFKLYISNVISSLSEAFILSSFDNISLNASLLFFSQTSSIALLLVNSVLGIFFTTIVVVSICCPVKLLNSLRVESIRLNKSLNS